MATGVKVFLDPRRGAALAVCEAGPQRVVRGGQPLGVTDCMNFGSPEADILWQFAEAIEGIAEACRALQRLLVVGGNVSLYNDFRRLPSMAWWDCWRMPASWRRSGSRARCWGPRR